MAPYVRIGYSARLTKRQEVHLRWRTSFVESTTQRRKKENNADSKGSLDFDKLECADTVNSRRSKGKASFVLRKTFLKPIENDLRGQKEKNFYEDFWNSDTHLGPASIAARIYSEVFWV